MLGDLDMNIKKIELNQVDRSYLIMKKRCEVALMIFKFRIHEFISLFSWKRVDELKKKPRSQAFIIEIKRS